MAVHPTNSELISNHSAAKERFLGLERRFARDPALHKQYCQFINEAIAIGHIRLVDRPANGPTYYIPHHTVMKKFRVVFDGSCKTSNGKSLNDILLNCPKVQDNLFDHLLRFRRYRFGLTADIKQMYRQVKLDKNQWDLQRIFFRASPNEPIQEYWITVVIWGLKSAGYNAAKALIRCGKDNETESPLASRVISNSFYMDDMLDSAKSRKEAKEIRNQTTETLAKGGFELCKFVTNADDHAANIGQDVDLMLDSQVCSD